MLPAGHVQVIGENDMARFLKVLMTMHDKTTWDIASALQKSQSHASQIVCGRRAPSRYEANIIAAMVSWPEVEVLFPDTFSGQSKPQKEKVYGRD